MIDPFEYFGLSPDSEKNELDKAYQLMKEKYEFDENADEVTKETYQCKHREIDNAYNMALQKALQNEKNRAVKQKYDEIKTDFDRNAANIINLINNKNYSQAEQLLNSYNLTNYAKWHYIYACLRYSQGWMNDAYIHIRIAFELEPTQPVYAKAYQNIHNMSKGRKLTSGELGIIIASGTFALVGTACVCAFAPEHLFSPFNPYVCIDPDCQVCCEDCDTCCGEPCQDGCDAYCESQWDVCCGCDGSTG